MNCKNCGNELETGAKFCGKCGMAINMEVNVPSTNTPVKKPLKINKSIIIVAVILLIVIIAGSIFLFNATATNKLEDAISAKNGDLVYSIYSEAFGNEKLLMKYDKVIAETIEDIRNDIDNHDFKDEAATKGGEAVENYCINNWGTLILSDETDLWDSISSENWNAWEELLDLIDSKGRYCDGIYHFTNGDYEYAILHLSSVIDSDSAYEDAQKMIQESVDSYFNSTLQTVEECIANGDFSGGLDLLENAKQYLDECGLNSDAISKKIDETLADYALSYAEKADKAFKEHDIEAAIGNIEVAMELQPDNGEYKTTYDTYQQYIPFELYLTDNILSYDPGEGGYRFKESMKANDNTSMENVLYIHSYVAKDFWNSNASDLATTITYNLGGKYDKVTGKLFLTKDKMNQYFPSYFEAYADGKLVYTSPKMITGELPKNITINVSNVQKLELRFYIEISEYNYISGEFGISDLTAQKEFPN